MAEGNNPLWVRLYLVPQTEGTNTMPPYVEGLMIKESTSSYILNPMLELHQDEDEEPYNVPVGMNFINKTYVWNCRVLERKPDASEAKEQKDFDYEDGGLG